MGSILYANLLIVSFLPCFSPSELDDPCIMSLNWSTQHRTTFYVFPFVTTFTWNNEHVKVGVDSDRENVYVRGERVNGQIGDMEGRLSSNYTQG